MLLRNNRLTTASMLLSIAIALSIFETYILSFFPFLSFYRLGIANICLLLGLFLIDIRLILIVFFGKVFIPNLLLGTLFTPIFIMGFTGTALALLSMIIVYKLKGTSLFLISLSGAMAHNLGQCLVLLFFMPYMLSLKIYGALMLSGLFSGIIVSYIAFIILKRIR